MAVGLGYSSATFSFSSNYIDSFIFFLPQGWLLSLLPLSQNSFFSVWLNLVIDPTQKNIFDSLIWILCSILPLLKLLSSSSGSCAELLPADSCFLAELLWHWWALMTASPSAWLSLFAKNWCKPECSWILTSLSACLESEDRLWGNQVGNAICHDNSSLFSWAETGGQWDTIPDVRVLFHWECGSCWSMTGCSVDAVPRNSQLTTAQLCAHWELGWGGVLLFNIIHRQCNLAFFCKSLAQ